MARANSAAAVAGWLDRVAPGLVAFELTGGHERILIAALHERGIPLSGFTPTTSSPFASPAASEPSPIRSMPG
jgi:hypothetical protein